MHDACHKPIRLIKLYNKINHKAGLAKIPTLPLDGPRAVHPASAAYPRAGNPAARSAPWAWAIAYLPKWKMLAARTALA